MDKMIRAWSFVRYGDEQNGGAWNDSDNFHRDRVHRWPVHRLTWNQFHFGICGFELNESGQCEILDSEERPRLEA